MKSKPLSKHSDRELASENQKLKLENEILRAEVDRFTAENERLKELAGTDYLTQIANRRSFQGELERRIAELERNGHGFCLLMLDIDQFKKINDRHGHAAGDRLLKEIADILTCHLRGSDFASRYGGDEFAIILPGLDLHQASHAAQRILDEAYPKFRDAAQNRLDEEIAISIGVVQAHSGMSAEQITQIADDALYAAKRKGGNQFCVR